jgi:hypothetical protein
VTKSRKRKKPPAGRNIDSQADSSDDEAEGPEVEQHGQFDCDDSGAPDDTEVLATVTTTIKKKKKTKRAKPLICTLIQYACLLEQMLLFHAWYKRGRYCTQTATNRRAVNRAIRRLMLDIKTLTPRTDGNGWKLQKYHELLHLVRDVTEYGNADNYDAGHGERALRTWAKTPAATSQKRDKTFVKQVTSRIHEVSTMAKAAAVIHAEKSGKLAGCLASSRTDTISNQQPKAYKAQKKASFYLSLQEGKATVNWISDADSTSHISPLILDWFTNQWPLTQDNYSMVGCHLNVGNQDVIPCWTEYQLPILGSSSGPELTKTIRAHPNYQSNGAFLDYITATFEDDRDIEKTLPAKTLCFFAVGDSMFALVFPCDYLEKQGTIRQRRAKNIKTKILERYQMEVSHVNSSYFKPQLCGINVNTIVDRDFVIEERPVLLVNLKTNKNFVWLVSDRMDNWAKLFLPDQQREEDTP